MNLELLETLVSIGFFAILGLTIAFLVLFAMKPGSRLWVLCLPFMIIAVYIPYESYFAIPEVSLNVPIRVDLLALIPLFEGMFVAATIGWFLAARKYQRLVGFPMSVVMGIATIAWPIYVALYLMGIGS